MKRSLMSWGAAVLLLTATLSGCGQRPSPQPDPAKEDGAPPSESTQVQPAADPWEGFVTQMEAQGVPFENLHTLENMGFSREEIMQMSAEEVTGKKEDILEGMKQGKIETLKQMAAAPETVRTEEQFVYTDSTGTERLSLVEQSIQSIGSSEPFGFTGYLSGGTVPIAYAFAFEPDGTAILMTYNDHLDQKEYTVTDIYEHPLFYHFTDRKELFFTIPKEIKTFAEKTPIEGYAAGEDLDGAALTAQQAIDAARETDAALDAQNARGGLHLNVYGAVVPETSLSDLPELAAEVTGACDIEGTRFYKVAMPSSAETPAVLDDVYYVSEDGQIVFLESMVAGELIPIGCKDLKHIPL